MHWGVYNIDHKVSNLPAGAGAVNATSYGTTILNSFGDKFYAGPCPPSSREPSSHKYVFTIYALSKPLPTLGLTNFPASPPTLYEALLDAKILSKASTGGFYSSKA